VSGPGVRVPFALDVRDARDPARAETVSGVLETDFSNPPALTVGRTLVSGVDLFDGHVVAVANDHDELAGESALPITRTYTSAGWGTSGLLGAGWSFGWDKTLTARLPCGRDVVHLGDGGGLAFRRELDGRLSPPEGYRSRLIENPDGTYDYFDLGNSRYRFAGAGDARRRRERLRLRSVTEPSGAEVVLRHDSDGRLVRVEEKRRGGARLELTYTRAGGFDRVAAIRDTLRRATVRYEYDPLGNLTQVTRTSAAGTQVLARYTYSVDDARDPHQLLSAETPTDTMRYTYYREGDRFAGEGTRAVGLPRLGLGASARAVTRETEQGDDSTLFGYDDSSWSEGTVRSWVASSSNDSAWQVTLYVLDQAGRVVEVKEHASAPTGLIAVVPPSCAVVPAPSGRPRSARLGTPARPAALCRRTD
jgi:YD repeat-containing protein